MEGIVITEFGKMNCNLDIEGFNVSITVENEYTTSKLVNYLSDISKCTELPLTEVQKSNLDFGCAKNFNNKLQNIGIFQRDRTDVWNVTDEYVDLIGDIIKFNNGNIKWLGIPALQYIYNILIK